MSTKSVNPPNSAKGRRYTNKEKEEILDFVDSYNAEHGRGGQSAATKKFKLSPLTISSWRKGKSRIPTGGIAGTGIPIRKKLAKLRQLHDEIVRLEKELARIFHQTKAAIARQSGKLLAIKPITEPGSGNGANRLSAIPI